MFFSSTLHVSMLTFAKPQLRLMGHYLDKWKCLPDGDARLRVMKSPQNSKHCDLDSSWFQSLRIWHNLCLDSTCPRKKKLASHVQFIPNTSVCTKCHGSPTNSCQDISPKIQTINLMVVLEEGSGELSSTLGTLYMSFQHFETEPVFPMVTGHKSSFLERLVTLVHSVMMIWVSKFIKW